MEVLIRPREARPPRPPAAAALLAALLGLALGCEAPAPGSDFAAQDLGVGGAGAAGDGGDALPPLDPAAGEDDTGDLSGVWFGAWEAHTCLQMATSMENVSVTFFVDRIEHTGLRLQEQRTVCAMEIGPVITMRTVIPGAVLEGMGVVTLDSTVDSLHAGARYVSGESLMLWGLDLEDPLSAALPADPDDPAVLDTDGDGEPGATLRIQPSVCDMGVVQRIVTRTWGRVLSSNGIVGTGAESNDQVVLWATSPFCKAQFPTLPAPGERNRFVMVRVDGTRGAPDLDADGDGTITCAEVMPHQARLLEVPAQDDAHCTHDDL